MCKLGYVRVSVKPLIAICETQAWTGDDYAKDLGWNACFWKSFPSHFLAYLEKGQQYGSTAYF
jgi:hypothetical protein